MKPETGFHPNLISRGKAEDAGLLAELGARTFLPDELLGRVQEHAYEIGAILRNPIERPQMFVSPSIIERRLQQFTRKLNLDFTRTLAWAFAQAVLSAIWRIEDGFEVDSTKSSLRLANAIQPMLGANSSF
ncbi:MAG: hypothetical protein M3410_18625 [Acidobacteriota bacterium]|nr:hypothetical protein [Acidobacteriota bacterium]